MSTMIFSVILSTAMASLPPGNAPFEPIVMSQVGQNIEFFLYVCLCCIFVHISEHLRTLVSIILSLACAGCSKSIDRGWLEARYIPIYRSLHIRTRIFSQEISYAYMCLRKHTNARQQVVLTKYNAAHTKLQYLIHPS